MFRFKLGLVLGFAAGWLVATGRAAELIDDLRARVKARSTPADDQVALHDAGVYDLAVKSAQ
jgi:hypothetical protein